MKVTRECRSGGKRLDDVIGGLVDGDAVAGRYREQLLADVHLLVDGAVTRTVTEQAVIGADRSVRLHLLFCDTEAPAEGVEVIPGEEALPPLADQPKLPVLGLETETAFCDPLLLELRVRMGEEGDERSVGLLVICHLRIAEENRREERRTVKLERKDFSLRSNLYEFLAASTSCFCLLSCSSSTP
ncbi:hypothetical protein GW17_00011164 [Ensete ventricosum]|nr:hypothetical protein GW17_00011164 [Ensete ventricosum]